MILCLILTLILILSDLGFKDYQKINMEILSDIKGNWKFYFNNVNMTQRQTENQKVFSSIDINGNAILQKLIQNISQKLDVNLNFIKMIVIEI